MEYHTTYRTCRKCENTYPLTSEYFVRDKKHSSGFMTQCKTCRNVEKKEWNDANPDKVSAMKRRDREKHPDRIKTQQQRWAENNPDHVKDYRQNYYAENREDIITKNLQYQRDNPEKVNAKNRRWRNENIEHAKEIERRKRSKQSHKERVKKWQQEHPVNPEHRRRLGRNWYWNNREKAIAKVQRRRAAEGSYTEAEIVELYETQAGMCGYCFEPLNAKGFHRDHIVPISRGGTNWIDNIILTCPPCNLSKGDKLPSEWKGRPA